jgi:hypothetical protein
MALGVFASLIFAIFGVGAYQIGVNRQPRLPPPREPDSPVFVALIEKLEDGTSRWRPYSGGILCGAYFIRLLGDGGFDVSVGGVHPGRVMTGIESWSRLKSAYQRALVNMATDAELEAEGVQ